VELADAVKVAERRAWVLSTSMALRVVAASVESPSTAAASTCLPNGVAWLGVVLHGRHADSELGVALLDGCPVV
jgi:hypothetical protein